MSDTKKTGKNKKRKLRQGFTTGSAAAAAAKGALLFLLSGGKPETIRIRFLSEGFVDIPVYSIKQITANSVECTVIKDGGDDPDITNKAEIGAVVTLVGIASDAVDGAVVITGGKGVGKVTKPGLEVSEGGYAINSGPVTMIRQAIKEVFELTGKKESGTVYVEVFVPKGELLAEKTLNKRLGIIGGISILGTTGVVKPLSHEAYVATIKSSLSVAAASKTGTAVFTTGRRSERFSQDLLVGLPEEAFIQIGDYFKVSMTEAVAQNFKKIIIAIFFGKALKMAQGFPHTHAGKSELTMKKLSEWTETITGDQTLTNSIAESNTARHAFSYLVNDYPDVIAFVGGKVIESARAFAGKNIDVDCIIFDFDGKPIFKGKSI